MNNDFQNQNNGFNPNMGMANPQPMNSPMPNMGVGNSMAGIARKSGNNKPLII